MTEDSKQPSSSSNMKVVSFIIVLCLVCGFLLASVSFALQKTQNEAKEFDRNKQMLIAAKVIHPNGYFEIQGKEGFVAACYDKEKKILIPSQTPCKATQEEIKEEANLRIHSLLTNEKGEITTFEKEKISLSDYLSENKKIGYASLPWKLFYAILPNEPTNINITSEQVASDLSLAESFVIPISGFGLWAPIYGYLAIQADGNTVIGTTWYEHAETPGLGANITEPWWQKQFEGKLIFQESTQGKTNFAKAPLGIIVVKGKVKDVFGQSAKSKNAVDGMSGATSTGDGVTSAYKDSLAPYRPLLVRIHDTYVAKHDKKTRSS